LTACPLSCLLRSARGVADCFWIREERWGTSIHGRIARRSAAGIPVALNPPKPRENVWDTAGRRRRPSWIRDAADTFEMKDMMSNSVTERRRSAAG